MSIEYIIPHEIRFVKLGLELGKSVVTPRLGALRGVLGDCRGATDPAQNPPPYPVGKARHDLHIAYTLWPRRTLGRNAMPSSPRSCVMRLQSYTGDTQSLTEKRQRESLDVPPLRDSRCVKREASYVVRSAYYRLLSSVARCGS